jgi:hypothetical protein
MVSQKNPSAPREAVVSLSDIWLLVRKQKRRLALGATIGAMLLGCSAVIRTPTYVARATFRDRPMTHSGLSSNLKDLLVPTSSASTSGGDQGLSEIMLSRSLLTRPIQELSLQAIVAPVRGNPYSLKQRISNNIKIELSRLRKRRRLPIADSSLPIGCQEILFDGELPDGIRVRFISEDEFDLYTSKRQPILRGKIGEVINCPPFHGKIIRLSDERLKGKSFVIGLLPLQEVVELIEASTTVTCLGEGSSLVEVSYCHPDRHQAAAIANAIVEAYLTSLRDHCDYRAGEQLSYLEERQRETLVKLRQFMVNNAAQLSDSLGAGHFLDLDSEIAFLGQMKSRYEDHLLKNELEIKLLDMVEGADSRFCDLHFKSNALNRMIREIQTLQHQRDALDFALKSKGELNPSVTDKLFQTQIADLQRLQREAEEIQVLLACVEANTSLPNSLAILDVGNTSLSSWLDHINESQQNALLAGNAESSPAVASEWEQEKSNFAAYLHNQLQTALVQIKIVQDRLAYQQNISSQFEGVDLETSQSLYLKYSSELDEVQRSIRQLSYALDHIHDPDFEISSLAATLTDSVSCEMISAASATLFALSDESNRSDRECARLQSRLDLQRRFVAEHVARVVDLCREHEKLVHEKLRAVQEVKLDLLHQSISILERELADYMAAHKKSLRHEQLVYNQHLKEIHAHMGHLPERWLSEREVDLCMGMAVGMVESLTEMVESKNIAYNLEVVESEPLDLALPPTIPNPPRLLLFAMLGAFLGFGAAGLTLTLTSMGKGFPASPEGLTYLGFTVAGRLDATPLSETNLSQHNVEILRKIMAGLDEARGGGSALIAMGEESQIGHRIATLFAKRGEKVLLIDCSLRRGEDYPTATLIQYLEGHTELLQPLRRKEYDYIPSGGASRYAPELLSSSRFTRLIQWAQSQYDLVLLMTEADATQAETQLLIRQTTRAAISLNRETTSSLQPLLQAAEQKAVFYFRPLEASSRPSPSLKELILRLCSRWVTL